MRRVGRQLQVVHQPLRRWRRSSRLALAWVFLAIATLACAAGQSGRVAELDAALSSASKQGLQAPAPLFVAGDEIELRVYGEEEFTGIYQVQDDGTIEVPLIGKVATRGLTQAELTQTLHARLMDGYLKHPQVTLVVKHRELRVVSVLGRVAEPGRVPYGDRLTLVQAISEAGGLSPGAQARRVTITRKTAEGVVSFEVSVQAITRGLREDVPLQPADIVFVPRSPI